MLNLPNPRGFPFSLQDLRSEFDQLMDRVWHAGLTTAPLDGQDWAPTLDVVEEADAYRVYVELPGVPVESVDVSVLGNLLTIRGTKPPPVVKDENRRILRTECRHGAFCRKYELPSAVREESVAASCRNGVLEIVAPKTPEVTGSKVKIHVEE